MVENNNIQVLAIEDNPADAMLIKEYLGMAQDAQYSLSNCSTLEAGQQFLRDNPIDVVLLDLSLPDAFEVSAVRKITSEFYEVCIIVITGNQNQMLGDDSLKAGAQDYLSKNDLSPEILSKAIKFAIHRKQSNRKLNYSLRVQEALAEIAMVSNQPRKFQSRIKYALDIMLGVFGMDTAYIIEAQSDGLSLKTIYGREMPGFTPLKDYTIDFDLDDFPTFQQLLKTNRAFFSHLEETIPSDFLNEMQSQGIKDLFFIPLTLEGHCFGFVGGNYVTKSATPAQVDENALFTIARIISNAYKIEKANAAKDDAIRLLTKQEHQLHEAQTQAQMGSMVVNSKLTKAYFSDSLKRLLNCNEAQEFYYFSTFKRLIHPDDILMFREKKRMAISRGKTESMELRIKRRKQTEYRYYWLVMLFEQDIISGEQELKITIQDIDELVKNRMQVSVNETILKEAQQISRMGDWQKQIGTEQFRISENLAVILGYGKRKSLSLYEFFRHIRKEDRRKILALKHRLVNEGAADVRVYYEKKNKQCWLELRCTINYDPLVRAPLIRGTIQDVTTNKHLTDKLKESAQKYESLLSSVEGMVYRCEVSFPWVIQFVSEGGKEITGYDVSEIYARDDFFKHIIHPDDIYQVSHFMTKSLENDKKYSVSYRIKHKNGYWRWVSDRGKLIVQNGKEYLEGILYDITERIMANELVTAAVMETEAKERKRISRDIHDGMQQTLTSAFLQFEGMKSSLSQLDERSKLKYARGQALLNKGIQESRAIAHQLMPLEIEAAGLLPTIETLVKTLNDTGLNTQFECNDFDEKLLQNNILLVIYRILQEAVNNVRKYAGDCEVQIQLFQYHDKIILTIEDNGKGFDAQSKNGMRSGLGLASMKHRADAVGGFLEVDSRPGRGTSILLEIPLVGRGLN